MCTIREKQGLGRKMSGLLICVREELCAAFCLIKIFTKGTGIFFKSQLI